MSGFEPFDGASPGSGWYPYAIDAPTQRIFIDLKSVTQEHFKTQNDIVIGSGDDFRFTQEVMFSSNGGHLVCNSVAGTDRIGILNGDLFINVTNLGALSDVSFITDNKLHVAISERISGVFTFTVDDVQLLSAANSNSLTINTIGGKISVATSVPYFEGIIANPDLGGGNAWKLDQNPENTEQSSGGNNLLTYVNIPTGLPSRELFTLNQAGTQWDGNNGTTLVIA